MRDTRDSFFFVIDAHGKKNVIWIQCFIIILRGQIYVNIRENFPFQVMMMMEQ